MNWTPTNWIRPNRSEVLKAIETYMAHAYSAAAPKAVQTRIDALINSPDEGFYEQKAFEIDPTRASPRYALRLGNRFYPHMKLIIEPTPNGASHLFRADTHDQHVRPQAGTRDAELFSQLMAQNQTISEEIEAAWEKADLPTFKSYLRQDLARRLAAIRAGDQLNRESGA